MPNGARLAYLSGAPHPSGFLRGLSFHSSKAWSMLLDKYLSISLRLNDYMAAKILIINEICNYFMLTLLKDRVINRCFMIKDRVIKGRFMTKDRVIMGYFVAAPQSGHEK